MKIQMKDRYNLPTGFGLAQIRQEGSPVSYDEYFVDEQGRPLQSQLFTEATHKVDVEIETDTTLTEEEQNDRTE